MSFSGSPSNKKNQSSQKNSPSHNSFQLQEFSYTTNFITHQYAEKILQALKISKNTIPTLQFSLKSIYQLEKIQNAIKIQQQGQNQFQHKITSFNTNSLHKKYAKKDKYQILKNKTHYRKKTQIDFPSAEKAIIFRDVYAQKIHSLQKQYEYHLIYAGKIIQVWGSSDRALSQMFRSQIWQMKENLVFHYSNSINYWQKLKYSHLLVQKLLQKGVKFYMRHGFLHNEDVVIAFYSITKKFKDIKIIVNEILENEIVIMKLFSDNWRVQRSQKDFFDLIAKTSEQLRKQISQLYEFEIEIDKIYGSFILHCKHETFGELPKKQLQNCLSNMIIVKFLCSNTRTWHNQLLKISKNEDYCLVGPLKKRSFVISIIRQKLKKVENLISIVKGFLAELDNMSSIEFYIPKIIMKQQTQRINILAQDYGLLTKQNNQQSKYFIQVKLKDLNEDNKTSIQRKQRQVLNFILKVVLKNYDHQFTKQQVQQMKLQHNKIKKVYVGKQESTKQIKDLNQKEQVNDHFIEYHYTQPEIIEQSQQKGVFQLGKKDRQLRKKFQQIDNDSKFKVEQLKYRDCEKIRDLLKEINKKQQKQGDSEHKQKLYIVQEIMNEENSSLIEFDKLKYLSLNEINKGEKGYLIVMNKYLKRYLATHKFQKLLQG